MKRNSQTELDLDSGLTKETATSKKLALIYEDGSIYSVMWTKRYSTKTGQKCLNAKSLL